MSFYRTTIVIWSDEDPCGMNLEDLAREAISGASIMAHMDSEELTREEVVSHDDLPLIAHFFPDLQEEDDA